MRSEGDTWASTVTPGGPGSAPGAVSVRAVELRAGFAAYASRGATDTAGSCRLGMVGTSAAMRHLYERVRALAVTSSNVLEVGETGTGKDIVAHAIHELGPRRCEPFVAVNCAALPRDLIESELFGHRRGAFSGANGDHVGVFRSAEGGTLFLDEITEMPVETQAKLLRALQERAVRPIGSTTEIRCNVRVIASTNRDPAESMRSGSLRRDLYYRLQGTVLRLPPLRVRMDDLARLVGYFLAMFSEALQMPERATITSEAMDTLERYEWPGNVRELMNAIESALIFGRSGVVTLANLPPEVRAGGRRLFSEAPPSSGLPTLAQLEIDLIVKALAVSHGNKKQAALMLNISRNRLYAKLAKYSLSGRTPAG